jgi:hypothetical protein
MRPALVLALLLTVGACGGERAGGPRPRTAKASKESTTTKEPPEARASDKGKKWGGWRYQGARDDCYYRFKRRCFTKRADACAAARCGKKQCTLDGAGPAIVTCQ